MTAKRLAEYAMDEAQTQALIGEEIKAMQIAYGALAVISRHNNVIPDDLAFRVLGARRLQSA